MTADEIAAITARQETRREHLAFHEIIESKRACVGGFTAEYVTGPIRQDIGDIDALLAEVIRLKQHIAFNHRARGCDCGHHSTEHDPVLTCAKCEDAVLD